MTCEKSPPDQPVKRQLIFGQKSADLVRMMMHRRWPNGFMGLLGTFSAFIGIGSNIGDRKKNIIKALNFLEDNKEIELEKKSCIYETSPVGYKNQDDFLNAVCKIKTNVNAEELLLKLKTIEKKMLRQEYSVRYGPRIIDLDILFFGKSLSRHYAAEPLLPFIDNFQNFPIDDRDFQQVFLLYAQQAGFSFGLKLTNMPAVF